VFNKNPTIVINGLSGLIQQVLPLLVVVGLVQLSPEKLAGWVSVIGLVLTFVSTTLLRSQVVPTEKANAQIETAISMPSTSTVKDVIKKEEKQSNG
jgi:hypothetical protein